MLITNLTIFLIAGACLVISSLWLVKSLSKIAMFLRISEFSIAFILMAFATSLPELSVTLVSAITNKVSLSLGTIIGSNIADITLVIGIPILLARKLSIKSKTIQRDSFHMFLIAILPLLLMLDKVISRIDGAILLVIFVLYIVKLWREKEIFKKYSNEVPAVQFLNNLFIFGIAFLILIFSSRFVVQYASNLAVDFEMPLILIGLLIVAFGAILPELAFGISAVMNKHKDMAVGNILGSLVIKCTLILGIGALIRPIPVGFTFAITSAFYMILVCFIFFVFAISEKEINWQEGIALVMLYIFFVIMELVIKSVSA